jgi:hypothetical protein
MMMKAAESLLCIVHSYTGKMHFEWQLTLQHSLRIEMLIWEREGGNANFHITRVVIGGMTRIFILPSHKAKAAVE